MASNAIPMITKRYQCDTCAKQFDIYSTFYSHKRSHTAVIVTCKACDQTFPSQLKLWKHYYNSHGDVRVHKAHIAPTEEAMPTKRKSTLINSWALQE